MKGNFAATAEHIYIEDVLSDTSDDPTQDYRSERISNRVNGTNTELTFYKEGFLKVRERRKSRLAKDHLLDLRFLDPKPARKQHTAAGYLWSALGCGLLALIAMTAPWGASIQSYLHSAAAILATLAVLSLMLFIHRSESKYRFRTASGKAVVLRLSASFGCRRHVRDIVRNIRKAIEAARAAETGDMRYLRAEMQAHYKLKDAGVISREACSNATKRILSQFD